ncbi:MAG: hypothetical protein DLM71_02040 [Chloroflexi bacterium]|nr:MAG: hypothetical protein DLM71_02040 [Chloroflexota bacterium]
MPPPPSEPMLRGELVWLRPVEREDLAAAQEGRELAHLAGFKLPFSSVDQERFWQSLQSDAVHQFVFCRLGETAQLGGVGLRSIDRVNGSAEVSIAIGDPGAWGQGLGTDAMNVIVDFAFGELRLQRVWLRVFDYNPRARRSYEKAGFGLEATLRHDRFHRGRHHDSHLMAMVREDWERMDRRRSWDLGAS